MVNFHHQENIIDKSTSRNRSRKTITMLPPLPYSGNWIRVYKSTGIRLVKCPLSQVPFSRVSSVYNAYTDWKEIVSLNWVRESTPHSAEGWRGKPVAQGNLKTRGPFQHKHPETDNSRWRLTTGAVGAPPARLTLTGVWSNTAAMDTFIRTVGCQKEKSIK